MRQRRHPNIVASATIEESSRESSAAEQRQPARLRAVGAFLLRIGDARADGETVERIVRDAVAMEVDFPAVAAENEAVSRRPADGALSRRHQLVGRWWTR